MVSFRPGDFNFPANTTTSHFAYTRVTTLPGTFEKRAHKQKLYTDFLKSVTGTKTVEMVTAPEGRSMTKPEYLSKEIAKYEPTTKDVVTTTALGAPVVLSVVAPPIGVPMLIGQAVSLGFTAGADILEDVIRRRPIRIDYPKETYVSSAIGGQVAGLVGGLYAPVATTTASRFLAGGSAATSGLFAKDVTEEPLKGEPVKLYSPLAYIAAFGIGGASYALAGKALDKIRELSDEGKITWIKPGIVREGKETWIGIYKERGPEASPLFGMRIRNVGGDTYKVAFGKDLTFTSYSPIKEAREINLPTSPIETHLKLPAMKRFYENLEKVEGLTPKQLEVARQFFSYVYTQTKTPAPVKSLREIVHGMDRAEGFKGELYNILSKYLKSGDVEVYGSVSQKMYGALGREVHDLDIQALKPTVAENLIKDLKRELGNKIVIKEKSGGSGWEVYNKAGEKVLELFRHTYGYGRSPYIGYGFYTKSPLKTEEGLFMRLEEQGARKMVSAFTPRETGFFPEEHRIKDVGDLISVMKFYSNKYPELKPLYDQFIQTGNPEVMKRVLKEASGKLTTTFAFRGSKPSTPNFYTSIFAGSSSSSISSFYASVFSSAIRTSPRSSESGSRASKSKGGSPVSSSPFTFYYTPYAPLLTKSPPSKPSYYPYYYPYSFPYSHYSYSSSYYPSGQTGPVLPTRLPPLPTLFPRNIDLNIKRSKLIYGSEWKSELSYV